MTLDALMDSIKVVFYRAATGPLRDIGWRMVRTDAGRDLQRMLRHDANLNRIDYSFNVVLDSDGRHSFSTRSVQAAQESWLRTLLGSPAPAESLEIHGHVLRRTTARATVEIQAIRRTPSSLVIGRGSSVPEGRAEGSRVGIRGGVIDADRLATLSGGVRSRTGARTATAPLPAPSRP